MSAVQSALFQIERNATLHTGDCLDVLRTMPADSVDAIVTDPPYGLAFMGKKWDYDVPSEAIWRECLRVLKPGGHLLAFAGTRTQHRMAVRIEDAGFEIRDMIAWVYGSGFPKSLNVAKAIESGSGRPEDIRRLQQGESYAPSGRGRANYDHGAASAMDSGAAVDWEPATAAARQWQGWGTALKPAMEPITVARKPLIGTVAANVLAHGTGALNVDGCRVPGALEGDPMRFAKTDGGEFCKFDKAPTVRTEGRWPANLIHDGSEEVVGLFPQSKSTGGQASLGAFRNGDVYGKGRDERETRDPGYGDSGSAARFFYCAKASKADRDEGNNHPTVKPTALMRYLCRLVTPPGGTVLDPFMGSGSTGKAAMLEGFKFIGIERDPEYVKIAEARIGAAV
jgi:site-specific DNA-methyltransferase (adenine-specific)